MLVVDVRSATGIDVIARIAQFAPKSGEEEGVLATLRAHRDFVVGVPGCRRAYLGMPIHGRAVLLYSEWGDEADVEGLEAALRSDPRASGDLFGLFGRLSAPMSVARFQILD